MARIQASQPEDLGLIGLEAQGTCGIRPRPRHSGPGWLSGTAQVGMGQCELGVERDGRAEMRDRIGQHALLHQQDPEIIVGLRIVRIDFQDLAEVLGSLRLSSQLVQEQAQIVVGLGIIGIDLDRAAVAGQGLIESPEVAAGRSPDRSRPRPDSA